MTQDEAKTIMFAIQTMGEAWRSMTAIVPGDAQEPFIRKVLGYYLIYAWGCDIMMAETMVALFDIPIAEQNKKLDPQVKLAREMIRARYREKRVSATNARKTQSTSE